MTTSLQDMPIALKVALAPVLVLLCLLALAGVGYGVQRDSAAALHGLSDEALPQIEAMQALALRTTRLDALVMRSLAYEGSGMKAKRIEQIDQAIAAEFKTFAADLQALAASVHPDDRAQVEAIAQILTKFQRMVTETLEMKSGGLSAAAMLMTSAESEFQALDKAVAALVKAVESRARTQAQASIARADRALVETLLLVLGALVLSVLGIVACVRMINRPLGQAVRIAQQVAEGDLSTAKPTARRDEAGQVLAALAQVSERLGGLMGQVQRAAGEIDMACTEIAQANGDLSHRTEETARSLQGTAQTVDQLASQTASNSTSAAQACRLASSAADVARQGGDVVGDVVATMEQINADAQRVREIIGVIDGIAFQTNILALNAAVEAARAGEQGRGFAVVAQEVRGLAGRSAASAREIRSLISATVEKIEGGTRRVHEASGSMTEVVNAVHEVLRLVSELAQAGSDQARGVAEVNEAVAHMDRATQQNAAMVEQAAAATLSLKQQAEALTASLAVFRVAGPSAAG